MKTEAAISGVSYQSKTENNENGVAAAALAA
jgi:hypothetical protein